MKQNTFCIGVPLFFSFNLSRCVSPIHTPLQILLNATSRRDAAGNVVGVIGVGQVPPITHYCPPPAALCFAFVFSLLFHFPALLVALGSSACSHSRDFDSTTTLK